VLDLGCGNGWLSARIAELPDFEVLGLDVNRHELEQAARVFPHERLHFAYGDIFEDIVPEGYFDLVICNACCQFFPDLPELLRRLLSLLSPKPRGKIHILDSPIYLPSNTSAARDRTAAYYQALGFPAMADSYHHHDWEDFHAFRYRVLYQPTTFINRLGRKLGRKKPPFPWVVVKP
jgi:trans-aconitate methyltransferase